VDKAGQFKTALGMYRHVFKGDTVNSGQGKTF